MFLPTRLNGAFVSPGARLGPEASPALPGEALPWCALPIALSDEGKQKGGHSTNPSLILHGCVFALRSCQSLFISSFRMVRAGAL